MRPESFDVQELIDSLQGTCQTMNDALPEGMDDLDLTSEDHDSISNQIFNCTECGWWYESYEEDDNGHCEGCSTIDDEEDEED